MQSQQILAGIHIPQNLVEDNGAHNGCFEICSGADSGTNRPRALSDCITENSDDGSLQLARCNLSLRFAVYTSLYTVA